MPFGIMDDYTLARKFSSEGNSFHGNEDIW